MKELGSVAGEDAVDDSHLFRGEGPTQGELKGEGGEDGSVSFVTQVRQNVTLIISGKVVHNFYDFNQ